MAIFIKQVTKYPKGLYLKAITNGTDKELLCVLPVTVEDKAIKRFSGRQSLISMLMNSISGALGWNYRVFVAAKTPEGKVMLLLLKTKTAEESLQSLKGAQEKRAKGEDPDFKHLDTNFATVRGTQSICLEDAQISTLQEEGKAVSFIVKSTKDGHLLRTHEFILTIAAPDISATDEERACFNESAEWLSTVAKRIT